MRGVGFDTSWYIHRFADCSVYCVYDICQLISMIEFLCGLLNKYNAITTEVVIALQKMRTKFEDATRVNYSKRYTATHFIRSEHR